MPYRFWGLLDSCLAASEGWSAELCRYWMELAPFEFSQFRLFGHISLGMGDSGGHSGMGFGIGVGYSGRRVTTRGMAG